MKPAVLVLATVGLVLASGLWMLAAGERREAAVRADRGAQPARGSREPEPLRTVHEATAEPRETTAEPERSVRAEGLVPEDSVADLAQSIVAPEPVAPIPAPDEASLEGRVHDVDGGAVAKVSVVVQASGGRFGDGEARTDELGAWRIDGLPAGVELALRVRGPGRTHFVPERVVLQPGELRVLDLVVGGRATIRGWVVFADSGRPVPDCEVWLVPGSDAPQSGCLQPGTSAAQVVRTDEVGEFVLTEVAAGSWAIGPSPWGFESRQPDDDWAPGRARHVVIAATELEREVELEVHRGLAVRGVVVDPTGRGVPDAGVIGQSASHFAHVQAGRDGAFVLGPLLPENYLIHASGGFGTSRPDLTASRPVTARPGDEVTLRLAAGAILRGRAVQAESRQPLEVTVELFASGEWRGMVSAFGEERFVFAGLQPGEYSLRAWTPERCGSVDRVIALAGTETAEVIIEMEPAATLVLRCSAGAGSIRARVRPARGLFVARNLDTFLPGDELRFVLPPGPTEITPSWIDPAAAGTRPDLAPRTVSLVVGEETVVDLGRP